MLSKEEIEKILEQNKDIITYKADKDFRSLTSSERTLLENNKKIKEYIKQLKQENDKLNKMIDEMIEMIIELKICYFKKEDGGELLGKYRFYNKEDWKQYFEKKAEEK